MALTEASNLAVAICSHRRPEQLRRALRSLEAQSRPAAEILVVDNAPPDSRTHDLVRGEFPAVRYVVEPTLGLDFARNRALAETEMEIVAFIDDDAVADRGWVEATEAVFAANPEVAICTGKVEALSLETEGQRLFEANGGFARGDLRIHLPRDCPFYAPLIACSIGVGSGCSMAVRRRVALALGGFDEALDMGAALPGGGDLDMLWRVLDAGHGLIYEPSVRALHEHRHELDAATMQILEHNRSLIAVLTKAGGAARGARRIGVTVFLAWRLLKPGVRLLRRALGLDPLPAGVLLRLWGTCWRGLGAYSAAQRLVRERREAW